MRSSPCITQRPNLPAPEGFDIEIDTDTTRDSNERDNDLWLLIGDPARLATVTKIRLKPMLKMLNILSSCHE